MQLRVLDRTQPQNTFRAKCIREVLFVLEAGLGQFVDVNGFLSRHHNTINPCLGGGGADIVL